MSEIIRECSEIGICQPEMRHLFSTFCLYRVHGVKIAHRKAENQIKMAKMIMMNELNKRANLLIEQLEVITFSLSSLLIVRPAMQRISNCRGVISPESKQTRAHNDLSKLLKPTSQELYVSKKKSHWLAIPPWCCVPVITCDFMHFIGFLQKISEDFQQRLEDQLQGAIEICGQLDHVQKFITWATTHHCRGPVLFSRTLVHWRDSQHTQCDSLIVWLNND